MKSAIILACSMAPLLAQGKNMFCKSRFGAGKPMSDYCTKFGLGEDQTMEVKVQATILNAARYKDKVHADERLTIQAAIYEDQNWDELIASGDASCEIRRKLAHEIIDINISLDGRNHDELDDNPGADIPKFKLVPSVDRPHIYFFKILDCDKSMQEKFSHDQPRIRSRWTIRSKDSYDFGEEKWSHFSYEDQNQYSLYFWLWISTLIINTILCNLYWKSWSNLDRMFQPHILMICSLGFQATSLFFEVIHLWLYTSDGQGVMAFDVFAKIFGTVSEVILSILFIMIASGWTIQYQDIDFDDSLDIYLPIGAIVIVIHIMISALDFIDIDDAHKYHDFAGLQGYFLIGAKLIVLAYFIYRIRETKLKTTKRQLGYITLIFNIGSLYLSAIPISIFTCYMCAPYNRQFLFTFFSQGIMKVTILILFYQLYGKKTIFHKQNLDSKGVLPGGMED